MLCSLSIRFLKSILNLIQDIVLQEFCIVLCDSCCAMTKEFCYLSIPQRSLMAFR